MTVVGVDIQDKEEAAREFLARFEHSFPNAPDPRGRVAVDYGVYGVPERLRAEPSAQRERHAQPEPRLAEVRRAIQRRAVAALGAAPVALHDLERAERGPRPRIPRVPVPGARGQELRAAGAHLLERSERLAHAAFSEQRGREPQPAGLVQRAAAHECCGGAQVGVIREACDEPGARHLRHDRDAGEPGHDAHEREHRERPPLQAALDLGHRHRRRKHSVGTRHTTRA